MKVQNIAEGAVIIFKTPEGKDLNETQDRIIEVLQKAKTSLTITEINKKLKQAKYPLSYKNTRENVYKLIEWGFLESKKDRFSQGQQIKISLCTEIKNSIKGKVVAELSSEYVKLLLKDPDFAKKQFLAKND